VHTDLIDGLYGLISGLSATNILEICAGNGKLTYWLNKRGLKVRGSDDYSWEGIPRPDFVENLHHTEALRTYNPHLVIACFPCEETTVPIDVLNHPSVKYYIHLGNAERSPDKNWRKEIERMMNVTGRDLYEIETYPTFDDDMEADRSYNKIYEVRR
jgi:hypothetical protein